LLDLRRLGVIWARDRAHRQARRWLPPRHFFTASAASFQAGGHAFPHWAAAAQAASRGERAWIRGWFLWRWSLPAVSWRGPAGAQRAAPDKRLLALEPHTRMIQLCNLSGLETVAKDKRMGKVDRVLIDALAQPTVESNVAKGAGGALRSKGQWYKFSYRCE